jgi:hypothetical protein
MADGQVRGGNGRFVRTVDGARRDAEACRLRVRGATFARIAEELGYADRRTALRGVERALRESVTEPAESLRALELARLDAWLVEAWAVMEREHVTVQHGKVVCGADGEPLRDDGPVLAAIDRLVKISERRSKLLGMDAPVRAEVVTIDQVDREIARLVEDLSRGAS